jgi:hypothetical protein
MQQRRVSFYRHAERTHTPHNPNLLHEAEKAAAGFNMRFAVWCTRHVGTMWCAYVFGGIGIGSMIGALTGNTLLALLCGSLSSYFLQLVLLPIIMVGQNVLNRKAEIQNDEMYHTNQQSFADIEGIMTHLSAQDEFLLKLQQRVDELVLSRLDELLETDTLILSGLKQFQRQIVERMGDAQVD